MPQVPYQPVPTVRPTESGPRGFSLSTPPAAFGGAVAQALEGLGKGIEGAGNELFQRAVAMQDLKNETEAKEADANYMIEVGKMHADFSSKEGKAAVDAFPDYIKGMQDLRKQMRDGLSNPAAQRMFDSQSLSTMGRTIFNGAGHAATQNKSWAVGSTKAQMDLDAQQVFDNPNDDVAFQEKLRRTKENVSNISGARGFEDGGAQHKDLELRAVSHLWRNRIEGKARTDPEAAAEMLDKNKPQLAEDDYLHIENVVRSQSRAITSSNLAHSVYESSLDADKELTKSARQMEEEVRAKAKEKFPNDPIVADRAAGDLHTLLATNRHFQVAENTDRVNNIYGGISKGAKNMQELRADPQIAKDIDALPAKTREQVPGWITRHWAEQNKAASNEREGELFGMRMNNSEAFLDYNVLSDSKLSNAQKEKIVGWQKQDSKKPFDDPRTHRAVRNIIESFSAEASALELAGTKVDRDKMNLFTGSVHQALDAWRADHNGRSPTYKEVIDQIAPEAIKQVKGPWFTMFGHQFGTSVEKEPVFQREIPETYKQQFRSDAVKEGLPTPSEEDIGRGFARDEFIKFFRTQKPTKDQGRAPGPTITKPPGLGR